MVLTVQMFELQGSSKQFELELQVISLRRRRGGMQLEVVEVGWKADWMVSSWCSNW
jgi:hypothetical protein